MGKYVQALTDKLIELLYSTGLSESDAIWIGELSMTIALIVVAILSYFITRKVMESIMIPLVRRTENQFDDILVKNKFFVKLSYLVPAWILYAFNANTISIPFLNDILSTLLEGFFVVNVVIIINSILSSANDLYDQFEYSKDHPLKALFQVFKIVSWIIGFMMIIGVFLNRDISTLFLSLGAVSAVLLLVFKDPILGLVGGFQLTFNKMLSIGDWIEMPKFGADGTVLEINLTTVKVQNWDNTVVTLPTYNLMTDSFKNWRGMEESGGRRIKRSINLDIDSIKFVDDEMMEKFKKIHVLRPYLDQKAKELQAYNEEFKPDPTSIINGRRQTNIGVFRAYLEYYLHNRTDIHEGKTFLVRQMQPTDKGLPIEIYVFAKTVAWAKYESIQADIFDHVMAAIPEFGLRIFQLPNNSGLQNILSKSKLL